MYGIMGVGLVVVAVGCWWMYSYVTAKIATLCPKCGGELDVDAEKYRHVVVYTCQACGETYEKLRNS